MGTTLHFVSGKEKNFHLFPFLLLLCCCCILGSATNSDSMLSFSSSGVSSTGSLHLSTASEVEDVLELEPDVNYKMHISSTYICNSELPKTEGTHVQVRPFQDKQSHNILVSRTLRH